MKKDFRQIVAEQRQELESILKRGWVHRENEDLIDIESRLAQVITGVRRSGKSTLAHRRLLQVNYAYANFDDERLSGIEADQLNDLLEALYVVYGNFTHLLLDEIQNVGQWHLFVNRLLRVDLHVVLTGSNSKLLQNELATHLTGRFLKTDLFPFSFREFLLVRKSGQLSPQTAREKGLLLNLFLEYLTIGGFPDILTGEDPVKYITALFEAIVSRDIVYRYNLKHVRTFRELAIWCTANFSTEISYNRLKNIFGFGSENTVKNYIQYLEEAYLISCLPKFSFKKQESLRYRKMYLIDSAFAAVSGNNASVNSGRLLENLVYLDLARKAATSGYEIFYYKKMIEVDFVIYRNRKVEELIQVTQSTTDPKTLKREVRALLAASRELNTDKLTLITLEETGEIREVDKVIRMVPVTEWLLG
jgi:predicted AAA+ superfamily ATPase